MWSTPIYINVRDRLNDLRALVEWLEVAGYQRIVLLDQASTYHPLLEYLAASPHEVIRLDHNWGSRAPWVADTWQRPGGQWFAYTDCDVLPTDDCPHDLLAYLRYVLDRFPRISKAGPGLFLDDVPADLPSLEWERSLVSPERERESGEFDSLIDTTFALYRPGAQFQMHAIRCGAPYLVRHMPWYRQNASVLAEDDRWYLEHADSKLEPEGQGTTWRPR